MRKRRIYTSEFKESAIELYQSHNEAKTAKEVAEGLGISPENLRRWLREHEEGEKKGLKVFPGQGVPRDEELARLRKENADLETVGKPPILSLYTNRQRMLRIK
jgi:transposase-like protein